MSVTTRRYVLAGGNRLDASEKRNKAGRAENDGVYTIVRRICLPLPLTFDYFVRHNLSLQDLDLLLPRVPERLLWLMCMELGIEITTAALPGTNAPQHRVLHGMKSVAKLKVKKALKHAGISWSPVDRFVCPHDTNFPPLPVALVTGAELESYHVSKALRVWRGIQVVFRDVYHGYIRMAHVMLRSEYEAYYGPIRAFGALPNEYLIDGLVYYETDELFLLQTAEAHAQLKLMTKEEVGGVLGVFVARTG